MGLSVDLHRSRERMVLSIEEERRRVGRDLHDDLGPRLAAISMQVELARDLTFSDPARAHTLLGNLLPAAVEVAAYRIALEAIQNVAGHAQARSCVVRAFHDSQGLTLEVADDGMGIPSNHPVGIGLQSMTERASELGGTLMLLPGPHGRGTLVRVVLPCRAPG